PGGRGGPARHDARRVWRLAPERRRRYTRERRRLEAAEEQRALDVFDGAGDLDVSGAGVGAVEDGAAAPDAVARVEHAQPLVGALIAAIEDEAVGVDDRRRADELLVGPERRTRRRARRAQDAFRSVVVPRTVLRTL